MSPLDKEAPQLRGMDGEGSVQVHQDAGVSRRCQGIFSLWKGWHWKVHDKFELISCFLKTG